MISYLIVQKKKKKRDNVLFGQPFEEERYWRVVEQSCLLPDLYLLPNGDMTEVFASSTKELKLSLLYFFSRSVRKVST